jgi:hypothetical protein
MESPSLNDCRLLFAETPERWDIHLITDKRPLMVKDLGRAGTCGVCYLHVEKGGIYNPLTDRAIEGVSMIHYNEATIEKNDEQA